MTTDKTQVTVTVTFTLPTSGHSLLCGARTQYWGALECYIDGPVVAIELDGGAITRFESAQQLIEKGFVAMAKDSRYMPQFGRLIQGRNDGYDTDLLIQFAVFGEEKYS